MELIWIIFVTTLAVTAAYFAGGFLDRRARARQEEEESLQRAQYLARLADFSRGFTRRLAEGGLLAQESAPEIACALCRYLSDYSGEGCSEEEWAWLKGQLKAPGEEG